MRLNKEALSTRVVVRRARRGAAPFIWEISTDSMVKPVHVSPEAFVSMEAAYLAGRAKLQEFLATQRPVPKAAETGDELEWIEATRSHADELVGS